MKDKAKDIPKDIPKVEVPKNPVDDEMVIEIKKLIEDYIPPFVERYSDKLKELTKKKNKTMVKNKWRQDKKQKKIDDEETEDEKKEKLQKEIEELEAEIKLKLVELEPVNLNLETIKELGLDKIEEPIINFIMHSVGPKIESVLPDQEIVKEKAMGLAKKAIAKLVDEAVGRIDAQIGILIAKVLVEEKEAAEVEAAEEIAEITEEPVEVVEDPVEEVIEVVKEVEVESKVVGAYEILETAKEVSEEVVEEPVEEIVKSPEVVEQVIEQPVEEAVEPKVADFAKVREKLIANILKKYAQRIEEKFLTEEEQIKAKELFKKRIVSIVDENLAKKKSEE